MNFHVLIKMFCFIFLYKNDEQNIDLVQVFNVYLIFYYIYGCLISNSPLFVQSILSN